MTKSKCRLFAITARAAPVAVILRRGPSAWYHLVRWDMRRDAFAHGAWIRGRIYESKCDLSPDGDLFVYSVYKTIRLGETAHSCYTAVSRPPWLRALVIWPQNTTYGGGGRFTEPRTLVLRGVSGAPYPALPRGLSLAMRGEDSLQASTDEVAGADWCGYDHRGRTIFTRGGNVFRQLGKREVHLLDLSDLRPNPQPPPAWATRAL